MLCKPSRQQHAAERGGPVKPAHLGERFIAKMGWFGDFSDVLVDGP